MTGFDSNLMPFRKLEALDERSAYESLAVLQRFRTQQDRLPEIAQQNQEDLQQQASDWLAWRTRPSSSTGGPYFCGPVKRID